MSNNEDHEQMFEEDLERRIGQLVDLVMEPARAAATRQVTREWQKGELDSPADVRRITLDAIAARTKELTQPDG